MSTGNKIVHICLSGIVTEGFLYQDNLLAKYHRIMGNDVTFITSSLCFNSKGQVESDGRSYYINKDDVHVYRLSLRWPQTKKPKLNRCNSVYETLCKEKPDIVFIHGPQFLDMPKVVKYIRKNRPKVYMDSHSDFSNSGRNWFSRIVVHGFLWRRMAKMVEPYCTRIYGVLPARVDFLHDIYGIDKEKLGLLVMGADDELVEKARNNDLRESIRKRYGIREKDILIVAGGKIDKFKWQTITLMKVVNSIKRDDVKLLVFGSIDKELKSRVERHVSEKVRYIGWLSPSDTYNYFEACDLAIFPGRHSVFWEQVAGQGKPMICKYWKGTTHIEMNGNVRWLNDDECTTLKDTLMAVLNIDGELGKMRDAAVQSAYHFSYREIAKRAICERPF